MSGRPLRILLSEGSSTSAREALTALGLAGHRVEICDPDPRCLSRFSRFPARFHRCPGMAGDPLGFLDFVETLLRRERFDVLLPIHEQGFLFAAAQERLAPLAAIALPDFDTYARVHSKVGFSRTLSEVGLPQPVTRFFADPAAIRALGEFPFILKTAIGTASRGIWMVRDAQERDAALAEIRTIDWGDEPLVVQDVAPGPTEHAQAVFANGEMIALNAYAQVARGAGGGPSIKENIARLGVEADLARLGAHLRWHGALSVDYILGPDGVARYVDCNPRLVEPMSAAIAGLDLTDLLLRVSLGERPQATSPRIGTRTHLALQALIGAGARRGSRRDVLSEIGRLLAGAGPYRGSREELTPVGLDWPSAIPATAAALIALARPAGAKNLTKTGWGAHLLTPQAARTIRASLADRHAATV